MVVSNDVSTGDFISEYQSLAQDIEREHPGCLRRFDLWTRDGDYYHGIIGGRLCPASDHHRRRREVVARFVDLASILPSPQASGAGA